MNLPRTSALTTEEIRSFLRRGFLLPGRVLTDGQISTLREHLDKLLDAQNLDDKIDRFDLGEVGWQPGVQSVAGAIPFITGLWKTDPVSAAVTFDRRIISWAGQLLGSLRLAFILDNVIITSHGVPGESSVGTRIGKHGLSNHAKS